MVYPFLLYIEHCRHAGFGIVFTQDTDVQQGIDANPILLSLAISLKLGCRDVNRDVEAAVIQFRVETVLGAQIKQHDLLEQVRNHRLKFRSCCLPELGNQIPGSRVWRALKSPFINKFTEYSVDRVFAQVVLHGIEHQATLAVVDIALVLHQHERQFFQHLSTTTIQVIVQLILQETLHRGGTILLLHHHQRRILRQGFGEHRPALYIGTDHLMCPPLMSQLMRRDIKHIVNALRISDVSHKANGL